MSALKQETEKAIKLILEDYGKQNIPRPIRSWRRILEECYELSIKHSTLDSAIKRNDMEYLVTKQRRKCFHKIKHDKPVTNNITDIKNKITGVTTAMESSEAYYSNLLAFVENYKNIIEENTKLKLQVEALQASREKFVRFQELADIVSREAI
jgi:hypothetical protein